MTDLEGFRDCPARFRPSAQQVGEVWRIQRDAYGRSRADEGTTDGPAVVWSASAPYTGVGARRGEPPGSPDHTAPGIRPRR
jgi:hypothetical protein